ncbi:cupin domain-containing protein [Saccharopolyspora indica]|uniref:cupin domain-containing protein n=1 Tax=Saccharopolyspora indica TaxID=1229659 RepID=UPI0022EB6C70|nr:cupin domain-containing protein [Saccharopolyspora indica]MDA3645670.1 cupin domain-containing protein [Saccharopolyspora indica]
MVAEQVVEHRAFDRPDEVREFENGRLELLNMAGGTVGRLILRPGWQWSRHVRPVAGTEWCEAPHFQYQISGRLHVAMSDGGEFESGPGSVTSLPQGHDAWVVGDEDVVLVDWYGATDYAKQA